MPVTAIPAAIAPSGIKSIQRGTITLVNATSNTAVINAVNMAKSELRFVSGSNNGAAMGARLELTNATTVSCISQATVNGVIGFEVTEWY